MSEQIRIQQLIDNAKRCNANNALARARMVYGKACGTCGTPTSNKIVPTESSLLTANLSTCAVQAIVRPLPVPESVRIQRVQSAAIECSYNQFNPETRFAMYKRYDPPAPCPAPTAAQLNSTAPKPTFFGCQPSRIFDSPI